MAFNPNATLSGRFQSADGRLVQFPSVRDHQVSHGGSRPGFARGSHFHAGGTEILTGR
jgi:hypothetical protein